jgi:hypothetical protein
MKKIAVMLRSNIQEWMDLLRAALPGHEVLASAAL